MHAVVTDELTNELTNADSSTEGAHPETFIRDMSRRAIETAANEAIASGKTLLEIRYAMRRAYPWSLPRGGTREYKIWRRELLLQEAALGLDPKTHKNRPERAVVETVKRTCPLLTKEEIKALEPKNSESAGRFLREYCDSMIRMRKDHDKLRIVLKNHNSEDHAIKFEYTAEIATNDPAVYAETYLIAAQEAYKIWADLEQQKQ